ncbi:HAD family hydrolase [Halalkalicoccus jeotgali]|uniref:HAD superfamily hydrolase n=1 Tax=Halalkalicoccus jeotgali (strain DSM 18796 / CECT 7217 / JCM 14584 / KCTC 4019 / B3) TaxID=795797 RepID=D8J8Q4_HALJB|nr:HAD family hydrolase [Halalkalicoccus jeotgali]ADJ14239.1 HAD-superfamily hydrolase, subfamily IA, variant 1 [Halalkalicoccus jeotgali B3]ELY40501.1 HAD superfamily hydrolase [Halalkalicoccus jeotgali B3]
MALRAVVFDLDYTLAVVSRDRSTLLAEASETVGVPTVSRETYGEAHQRAHAHETRGPIFADLLEEGDGEALAEAYRNAIAANLEPIGGAESLVRTLEERYAVGLLTNGPVVAQRDKLRTLGWEGLFDAAVITGELKRGKPHPEAFEAILGALEVSPEEAVYVGDSVETDIAGAAGIGMAVVQVLYPGGPDPDPRANAHVERETIVEDLPDLITQFD